MGYQYRIKRFLAYSSISHLGLLLLALSHLDLNNYYIYYWIYMLTTINIFLILIVILKGPINNNNNNLYYNDLIYLNQLKGLFLINKPLTIGLGINFLSLAGIPPLAGFFAKAWIFISLINLSDWVSALFIIMTSTIGTAYYIK
jgi:NADH:ubiquinone oxidoreductase subunit 2 (subunit N)